MSHTLLYHIVFIYTYAVYPLSLISVISVILLYAHFHGQSGQK